MLFRTYSRPAWACSLSNLSGTGRRAVKSGRHLRNAEHEEDHAQELVEKAEGKGRKEKKVKIFGLRAVKVSNL